MCKLTGKAQLEISIYHITIHHFFKVIFENQITAKTKMVGCGNSTFIFGQQWTGH